MKLGTPAGLGPGHIVLDEDPALPPPKGQSPQFLAHICCGQMAKKIWPMFIVAKRLDGSR